MNYCYWPFDPQKKKASTLTVHRYIPLEVMLQ